MPRQKPYVVLPEEVAGERAITVKEYQEAARRTDRMEPKDELGTPIFGLFGEIGSLLAALKKRKREGDAFATYDETILEELGDVLWYLCTVASHAGVAMAEVACHVPQEGLQAWSEKRVDAEVTFIALQGHATTSGRSELSASAEELAACAGELVEAHRTGKLAGNRDAVSGRLLGILRALVGTAQAAQVPVDLAARENLLKTYSRWPLDPENPPYPPPLYREEDLPKHERLPRRFKMFIKEHTEGRKTYVLQKCNGVLVGDRLTDNKTDNDDYRFHDVFHIAYAVHLEWSPVLRALLKIKRKSNPKLDENEDGARAILVEEGIATLIFAQALERKLFAGLKNLDYDLLKFVQRLARGFEPERFAAWQWERAILDGFKVFREITAPEHRGGWVVADLDAHKLTFEPATDDGLYF